MADRDEKEVFAVIRLAKSTDEGVGSLAAF